LQPRQRRFAFIDPDIESDGSNARQSLSRTAVLTRNIILPSPAIALASPTMVVTRTEEWCAEADSAEEAQQLLASGQGHRCHHGDAIPVELGQLHK
jgi:hypothetical protein